MNTHSTTKATIIENNKNKSYANYIPKTVNITKDFVNWLFNEENCTVVKLPNSLLDSSIITFYRNDNPGRIMVAHINDFCDDPNKNFRKSDSKSIIQGNEDLEKLKNDRLEKQRQEKEDNLKESMKNEDCELTSKFIKSDKPVYYLYNGLQYKTTPTKWNKGYRAHQSKCPRYTHEHIAQLFKNEGCELLSHYENQKSKLTYQYEGKIYNVIWNDWKFYNSRPHLGLNKTYWTEKDKEENV